MNAEVGGAERRREAVNLRTGVFKKVRRGIHPCKEKEGCMIDFAIESHLFIFLNIFLFYMLQGSTSTMKLWDKKTELK